MNFLSPLSKTEEDANSVPPNAPLAKFLDAFIPFVFSSDVFDWNSVEIIGMLALEELNTFASDCPPAVCFFSD